MNKQVKRILKKTLRILLNVLTACLLLCAILCSYMEHGLFNVEGYQSALLDETFDECVSNEVTQTLDNLGSVVEIPRETIIQAIGIDHVIAYAHDYTNHFMNNVFNGETKPLEDFTSEPLRTVVSDELTRYSERENVTVTQESVDEVYAYILERINQTLHYIPNAILNAAQNASQKTAELRTMKKWEFPLYGASLLCLLVNLLFAGRKKTNKVLFGAVSAAWCAIATVFFPLLLLAIYSIPSHIALTESTLFCLLTGICQVLITRPAVLLGLIMLVLTAALIFFCSKEARQRAKPNNAERDFYRVDFSHKYGSSHHKKHSAQEQEKNS